MLAFVAVRQLTKVDWDAPEDQERFPYSYAIWEIALILAEASLVRQSASGTKVREGGHGNLRHGIASCLFIMGYPCSPLGWRGVVVCKWDKYEG